MSEFFGDLERLAADAYPWRWLIFAGLLVAACAAGAYAYRSGWHHWVLRRWRPISIAAVPVLALVGFLAYDLGSPLFINKTVEEEFPFAFSATVPSGMDRDDVEQIMAGIAAMDQDPVDESMAAATPSAPAQDGGVSTTAASSSARVKTGDFRDQDSFHKGSGQATIYGLADGTFFLRLDNLRVTNGPDLHVILSPHPDPATGREVKTPGYLDLGKLKGNRGNQNYEIPAGVDVDAVGSVVIYCKPFHVVFSVAPLAQAG